MTIFLCGFMGCGKTTAGRLAAKKLGYAYFDTDELIVQKTDMTIPEIFSKKGEPFFRQIEAEIVVSLCEKNAVVSCGGGAMLNSNSAMTALKNDCVVFLDVPFEVCYNRIENDTNRPIASSSTKDELHKRYLQRYDVYMNNSNIQIDCSGTPTENADLIISAVKRGNYANL